MNNFAVGVLGATVLAATILLVRQQREMDPNARSARQGPSGETKPTISLERMRELGL